MTVQPALDLSKLQTETRNPRTTDIDVVSTLDMCRLINNDDIGVPKAVSRHLSTIAKIVDEVSERVRKGGRVIYMGAGTSGRLGVLDASEIPPTYSAPTGLFIGLMAGGDHAIQYSVEGAEDEPALGVQALNQISPPVSSIDSVIGIAASGRTPYVLGGLHRAKEIGCYTAGIACSAPSAMKAEGFADVVECVVGPEVVTGSTRMKSGTATKLILNMISTGVMIRTGKTFGNLMGDIRPSNHKLVIRARSILRDILSTVPPDQLAMVKDERLDLADNDAIDKLIDKNGGVKQAAVAIRFACTRDESEARLDRVGGVLKRALQ